MPGLWVVVCEVSFRRAEGLRGTEGDYKGVRKLGSEDVCRSYGKSCPRFCSGGRRSEQRLRLWAAQQIQKGPVAAGDPGVEEVCHVCGVRFPFNVPQMCPPPDAPSKFSDVPTKFPRCAQ